MTNEDCLLYVNSACLPNALKLGDGHLSAVYQPFLKKKNQTGNHAGASAMIGNQGIQPVNPQCPDKGVLSGMVQTLRLALFLIDSKQESFHE